MGKMKNMFLLTGAVCAMAAMAAGCLSDCQREELRNAAHTAILEYVETEGLEKALAFVDQLVAEGRLGAANAEKIKAAIPEGIDHLREVMGEIEQEAAGNE